MYINSIWRFDPMGNESPDDIKSFYAINVQKYSIFQLSIYYFIQWVKHHKYKKKSHKLPSQFKNNKNWRMTQLPSKYNRIIFQMICRSFHDIQYSNCDCHYWVFYHLISFRRLPAWQWMTNPKSIEVFLCLRNELSQEAALMARLGEHEQRLLFFAKTGETSLWKLCSLVFKLSHIHLMDSSLWVESSCMFEMIIDTQQLVVWRRFSQNFHYFVEYQIFNG